VSEASKVVLLEDHPAIIARGPVGRNGRRGTPASAGTLMEENHAVSWRKTGGADAIMRALTAQGPDNFGFSAPVQRAVICLVLLALAGLTAVRLAAMYDTFTATFDEPYHLAAGMQWLCSGKYTYDLQHPPLGRVALAAGPWLAGFRSHNLPEGTQEGNAILGDAATYLHVLRLARLGNLPFLCIVCLVVFLWARRWFDTGSALCAVILLLSLPPILGHAALATLDIACVAGLLVFLYQLLRWLESPGRSRTALVALALGLALLTKLSNLVFIPACCIAVLLYWLARRRQFREIAQLVRRRAPLLLAALLGGLLVTWAGYRFSLLPYGHDGNTPLDLAAALRNHPMFAQWTGALLQVPLPLSELVHGTRQVARQNSFGNDSYLLGQYHAHGTPLFFPVVVLFKTPLGFLLLAGAGFFVVARGALRRTTVSWQQALTALFPLAVFLPCVAAGINLGVRHILAIYPFAAILAGHFIARTFSGGSRRLQAIALLLGASVLVDAWRASPDYLAWFNQLAGDHPEHILAESDLDWGQDLNRLGSRLKALGANEVAIAYFGVAPFETAGITRYRVLSPVEKTTGYVAVSVHALTIDYAADGSYAWLKAYTPLERVGKSIFLYRIDR
jgi:Dolichyl-phosphate-mannose-protein mannosyltransferase